MPCPAPWGPLWIRAGGPETPAWPGARAAGQRRPRKPFGGLAPAPHARPAARWRAERRRVPRLCAAAPAGGGCPRWSVPEAAGRSRRYSTAVPGSGPAVSPRWQEAHVGAGPRPAGVRAFPLGRQLARANPTPGPGCSAGPATLPSSPRCTAQPCCATGCSRRSHRRMPRAPARVPVGQRAPPKRKTDGRRPSHG